MAYRNPRYYFTHTLRTAGAANLGGSTFSTANPRAYVHDSGRNRNGTFNAAAVNQYVKVDQGASFASLPVPRYLIIPSGHNLAGTTLAVRNHNSDPPDGVTGTLLFSAAVAAGHAFLDTNPGANQRWWTITVPASGAWSYPELWLAQQRTTTRGPDPSWKDAKIANQFEAQMRSGETYRLELGSERRYFEFTYRALSGTDLAVFTDMRTETRNGLYPMYVDPPDDSESAILMQLLGGLEFEQDYGAPASATGMNFKVTLRLLEVLA